MKMFVAGDWVDGEETIPVLNPFNNEEIDSIPKATATHGETALAYAVEGAKHIRKLSGYDRYQLLMRVAQLMKENTTDLAQTITLEEGKILSESTFEVSRAIETMICSAEESKRLGSEVIPLDGAPGVGNQFGFTLRVPCGVVLAITPFNFPLNLVVHKIGPALAGGNSVILKPATDTPLTALKMTEIMLEAGVPPEGIQCLTGAGREIGGLLCADSRIRKISFTGSRDVGEQICRSAGLKKVTMELGSNAPIIVLPDADLDKAAAAIAVTGFSNAGQVCISAQRILTHSAVYADLLDALKPKVEALVTGNPLADDTNVGPMVREQDAIRVGEWITEAAEQGARVITGGQREGAVLSPSILADVNPAMRISSDEVFGPAVALTPVTSVEEAITLASQTNYGQSAAIFTENLDNAMRFAREVDSGNLHINWGSQWRADLMPYGGLKESGFGKEGPKYAVQEMTETKMVVMHV